MKEEALLELPSGYKNTEITEEQLKKRQQRAKKRREQAHEKREKDKVHIMRPAIFWIQSSINKIINTFEWYFPHCRED